MASNSLWQFSSSRVLICFQTASSALGQYLAGVGKQALKLAYELVLTVEAMAEENTFCSAVARGPGVDATGAEGGGEGDAEFRGSMATIRRNLWSKASKRRFRSHLLCVPVVVERVIIPGCYKITSKDVVIAFGK